MREEEEEDLWSYWYRMKKIIVVLRHKM